MNMFALEKTVSKGKIYQSFMHFEHSLDVIKWCRVDGAYLWYPVKKLISFIMLNIGNIFISKVHSFSEKKSFPLTKQCL